MREWIKLHRLPVAVLLLAFCWSCFLVLGRVAWTWQRDYLFLGFNLGLAMLPLIFSVLAITTQNTAGRFSFACLWLLFLPNAPYILTDLIHLEAVRGAPIWFDLLMITSCAVTGIAAGFFSLALLHAAMIRAGFVWRAHLLVIASCFATAFGIYLGRVLRWHSVHLFASPALLLNDIADRFLNPLAHPRTWGFTLGFGTLLTLCYFLWVAMSESLLRQKLENSVDGGATLCS